MFIARAGRFGGANRAHSSTLISIDRSRQVRFDEWSWNGDGAEAGRVNLPFALQAVQARP